MDLEVVNAVGSGDLGIEIDLHQLTANVEEVEFDPNKYPGAYVRLDEVEPLITVYRTGKYIITGSTSEEEAYSCEPVIAVLPRYNRRDRRIAGIDYSKISSIYRKLRWQSVVQPVGPWSTPLDVGYSAS